MQYSYKKIFRKQIEKIDQSEFDGFEYVNPLLMSLEDCVWQEPLFIVQRHNQDQQQQYQLQQCYMYELQDRLAKLRIDPLLPVVGSSNQGYHNNVFLMTYSEENENDNNYNEHHRLPPPFPFRYESPTYSRSLSITDVTYNPGNNNAIVSNYDENDYDDMEDENPRKGLLKQIFCLPLN